jgi:DNA-binding HxlR family transcriptional regulator
MYEKKIPKDFSCGMAVMMEIIGGKWKTYLIFLINQGVRRPSDIQRAVPSATRRVLNLQLRELEFHGIIKRVIYPELPPRVEYFLTEFGTSILPVVEAMDSWGAGYLEIFRELMEKKKGSLDLEAAETSVS